MSDTKKAVLFSLLGFFIFSLGDTARKFLLDVYEPLQIQFWASFFSMAIIICFSPLLGGLKSLTTPRQPVLHGIKAIIVCALILLVIFSLQHLDLATFYTLVFLSPIFSSVGGALFFKERLHLYHVISLLIGFSGTLVVLRPGFQEFDWAMIFALVVGLLFSASSLLNKLFIKGDAYLPHGFYPYFLACIICAFAAQGEVVPVSIPDLLILVLAGAGSALGLVCIVVAFQAGPAATAAPYHYTQLLWGALFGFLLFRDIPDMWTIIGAIMIIGAGGYLYIVENTPFRKLALRGYQR